jgi:hypothetical protein
VDIVRHQSPMGTTEIEQALHHNQIIQNTDIFDGENKLKLCAF